MPKQGRAHTAVIAHLKEIKIPMLAAAHQDLRDAVVNHLFFGVVSGTCAQTTTNILWNSAVTPTAYGPPQLHALDHRQNSGLLLPDAHQAHETFGLSHRGEINHQEVFGEGMRVGIHQFLVN